MLTGDHSLQRKGGRGPAGAGPGAESGSYEVTTSPAVKAATLVVAALALGLVGVTLFLGRGQIVKAISGATTLISSGTVISKDTVQLTQLTSTTQAEGLSARGGTEELVKAASKNKAALGGAGGKKKSMPKPKRKVSDGSTKLITEITLANGTKMQIFDEPIPEDCYAEEHLDLDGFAVKWGLNNKAKSAADCCRQCKEFVPPSEVPSGCNAWVWCGDPSGMCWTMDIHTHTTGDCWLKHQAGWDGLTDRSKSNLKVNHEDKFSDTFRSEHKTAPEYVPWTAGVVAPTAAAAAAATGAGSAKQTAPAA